MALENTGKAFPLFFYIVKKVDGENHYMNDDNQIFYGFDGDPFPNTEYSLLTEQQAKIRVDAYLRYLQRLPQYKGLIPELAVKNEAIITDHARCPLPSQAKKLIITLKSDNESVGTCRFSENNMNTIEIEEGVGVHPTVEILNENYEFDGWYKNGTQKLNTLQQTITYFLTESCTLVAKFKAKQIEPEPEPYCDCYIDIPSIYNGIVYVHNGGTGTARVKVGYRTSSGGIHYIDVNVAANSSEMIELQAELPTSEDVWIEEYDCI